MCHVLIIEDETMIALDLELLLGCEETCTFAFAVTEEEAVEEARAHRPDVITADVTLLEGTGPAAVEKIRQALGEIQVIYISAIARECCAENRLTRLLPKPLNRPTIVTAFHELRSLARSQT